MQQERLMYVQGGTKLMDIAFGTKIINRKTNQIGLLIKTWLNEYADGGVWFATCVDTKGKRYYIELDEIAPLDEDDD